jgi:hypothetical protein
MAKKQTPTQAEGRPGKRTEERRRSLKARVVFYPDEGSGGFTAVIPALPGLVTEGETREEVLANLREALEGYLLCTPGAFELREGGVEEEVEL